MTVNISRKVLIIADKPSHYRVDLYNMLAERLKSNITFYFIMDPRFSERNIISVFDGELFHANSIFLNEQNKWKRTVYFINEIIRIKPDIVINIGLSLRMIFLALYVKLLRKKLVIWWSGTKESEKNISLIKSCYRKFISQYVDGAILYSEFAKEYILGINRKLKNLLVLGNNTLDSARYFDNVSLARRGKLPVRNNKVNILTVGFLIKRKNVITLLKAYKKVRQKIVDVKLTIVGKGPELDNLKEYSRENNIQDVNFKEFVPYHELPKYYAIADIYVHPALYDQWPQTYNEAASSGLSILISSTSGVYNEYIEKYKENVLFNPEDEETLRKQLEELIMNKQFREELRQKTLEVALKNDCKTAVDKLSKYIEIFNR